MFQVEVSTKVSIIFVVEALLFDFYPKQECF